MYRCSSHPSASLSVHHNRGTPMTTIYLNGNSTSTSEGFGELDEAILADLPDQNGLRSTRIIQRYERYTLHKANTVHIQRQLIQLEENWNTLASTDELVVWLKTPTVKIQSGTHIVLEVDDQTFEITPSSAEQRLVLQFEEHEVPEALGEGFNRPLRMDGHATRESGFDSTAVENLYLYGTAQFRARVFEQLALLDGHPALRNLLQVAQDRYEEVPVVLLMQLQAGPPQFGPGYTMRNLPTEWDDAFAAGHTNVLYDPYASDATDALTVLVRVLQGAYDALSTGNNLP